MMNRNHSENNELTALIKTLHFQIYDAVRAKLFSHDSSLYSVANEDGAGDVSYDIDIASEETIEHFFSTNPIDGGAIVIAEGIGQQVFPATITEDQAKYRILIDPIDGTREIMYNKRSAWVLTAVAPNRGNDTNLSDVFLSMQTELPVKKQALASVIYATKNGGAWEEIWNIDQRELMIPAARLQPSQSKSIDHGYVVFTNYFPGTRDVVSALADRIISSVGFTNKDEKTIVFDDQYISSGGQIYLLASGIYRFAADLRPALTRVAQQRNSGQVLCCHPYDIGGMLILQEAGGIVTDLAGREITYPMDTNTKCGWLAYANDDIRRLLEPLVLKEINLL